MISVAAAIACPPVSPSSTPGWAARAAPGPPPCRSRTRAPPASSACPRPLISTRQVRPPSVAKRPSASARSPLPADVPSNAIWVSRSGSRASSSGERAAARERQHARALAETRPHALGRERCGERAPDRSARMPPHEPRAQLARGIDAIDGERDARLRAERRRDLGAETAVQVRVLAAHHHRAEVAAAERAHVTAERHGVAAIGQQGLDVPGRAANANRRSRAKPRSHPRARPAQDFERDRSSARRRARGTRRPYSPAAWSRCARRSAPASRAIVSELHWRPRG